MSSSPSSLYEARPASTHRPSTLSGQSQSDASLSEDVSSKAQSLLPLEQRYELFVRHLHQTCKQKGYFGWAADSSKGKGRPLGVATRLRRGEYVIYPDVPEMNDFRRALETLNVEVSYQMGETLSKLTRLDCHHDAIGTGHHCPSAIYYIRGRKHAFPRRIKSANS